MDNGIPEVNILNDLNNQQSLNENGFKMNKIDTFLYSFKSEEQVKSETKKSNRQLAMEQVEKKRLTVLSNTDIGNKYKEKLLGNVESYITERKLDLLDL